MKLAVVIVNYNVQYFLEQCLDSVQRAVAGMDAEVWVVDNESVDGSVWSFPGLCPRPLTHPWPSSLPHLISSIIVYSSTYISLYVPIIGNI